jgi:tight adherence protein B
MSAEMLGYAAAALAFVAVVAVGFALFDQPSASVKRAKSLHDGGRAGDADPKSLRRKQMADTVKTLREREQALRKARTVGRSIEDRLRQAGLAVTVQQFWLATGALGLVSFVGLLIAGQQMHVAAGLSFALAFGLPRWVIGFIIGSRQKKFSSQFADAIDVIVRGVKSGLPLNECLKVIARESPQPIGGEFERVVDALAMGVSLDQALARLYQRTPIPEVNFFSIVLAIQAKGGGNLSEALGNLSGVLRSRKMLKEKIKAMSSEAKASAMIIGALPVVVMVLVYLTTPAYMMSLFTTEMGNFVLMIAATLMGLGIFIMRSMINFKF